MGEIAYEIVDRLIFGGPLWGRKNNPQRGVGLGRWMSTSGPLEIAEMDDEHIINAFLLCRRQGNNGKGRELMKELKRRKLDWKVS